MTTLVRDEDIATLQNFRLVGDQPVAHSMVHAVEMHRMAADCIRAGGLLIAVSEDSVDTLNLPDDKPLDGREPLTRIRADVGNDHQTYLAPLCDENNPEDLVPFWSTAVSFYCEINERHLLGASFHRIFPGTGLRNMSSIQLRSNPLTANDRRGISWPRFLRGRGDRRS